MAQQKKSCGQTGLRWFGQFSKGKCLPKVRFFLHVFDVYNPTGLLGRLKKDTQKVSF
jgi:hypothetical protein